LTVRRRFDQFLLRRGGAKLKAAILLLFRCRYAHESLYYIVLPLYSGAGLLRDHHVGAWSIDVLHFASESLAKNAPALGWRSEAHPAQPRNLNLSWRGLHQSASLLTGCCGNRAGSRLRSLTARLRQLARPSLPQKRKSGAALVKCHPALRMLPAMNDYL
jgi:hypothetical protein